MIQDANRHVTIIQSTLIIMNYKISQDKFAIKIVSFLIKAMLFFHLQEICIKLISKGATSP